MAILDRTLPAMAVRWADARSYLGHNELGLAFDIIVDALLDDANALEDVLPAFAYLERVHTEWERVDVVDHKQGWELLRQRLS